MRSLGALHAEKVERSSVGVTVVCMGKVDRFSVTLPPDLGDAARESAVKRCTSISAWISRAACRQLLNERLGEALDAWESEDGSPGEDELMAAAEGLANAREIRPRRSVT